MCVLFALTKASYKLVITKASYKLTTCSYQKITFMSKYLMNFKLACHLIHSKKKLGKIHLMK